MTLKIIRTIIAFLALTWLAIFSGLEYDKYIFVYSTNSAISAIQYIINYAWGISLAVSPLWIAYGSVLVFRIKMDIPIGFCRKCFRLKQDHHLIYGGCSDCYAGR